MAQVTLACVADARVYEPNTGSGASNYLPVGLWSGSIYRSALRFALPNWTALGVRRVTSAKLRVRNSTQVFAGRGATPRLLVKRATANWVEGTSAILSASNGGGVVWPGPGTTSTNQTDSGTLPTANDTWIEIDVTAQVRVWAPTTVELGEGVPNYGFVLHSFDEGSTTRTTELYSRETSSKPVLIITYESNTAPFAPTILAPATEANGDASIAPVTRTPGATAALISFNGRREDPDPGDYLTGLRIQVLADAATDAAPGTVLIDRTFTDFTGEPAYFVRAVSIEGALTIGTVYRWRALTRDKAGLWGAWSSLTRGRFKPNTVPAAPANVAVDPGSQTPNFYGSLVDADPGATIGNVEIEVFQDSPAGALLKWASGKITSGGTRYQVAYGGGQVLEYGIAYRWRSRLTDNVGSEGPWGAWLTWTPRQIVGASNMTPRTIETKQNTLTPTLTIAHSAAFDAYELEVARYNDGSELLWDVPLTAMTLGTSVARVYAGASLDWGRTYWWRARIRVGGTSWSEWSPWYPFYVNARPLPTVVSIDGAIDPGANPYPATAGYVITTSTTPTIRAPFNDPDRAKGYVDNPTRREVYISNAFTGVPVTGSPFVATSGITDTFVPAPGLLAFETTYSTTTIYEDSAGQRSQTFNQLVFKVSQPPTIGAGTAPDVTDPAPSVAWTFASPGGKAQLGFAVQVFDNVTGTLVHDSGFVTSTALAYTIPGEVLAHAKAYRATVVVYDTDMLSGTTNVAPWTTAFSAPAALTGLVATPDPDASEVDLAWNVPALPATHFWRYYIYRRSPESGEFRRIGEVADRAAPAYSDREAPHGVSAEYAVTVSNGWAEAEEVTAVALIDLKWWIVNPTDPALTFELRYVNGYREQRHHQQESFEPLGRPAPLVVSGVLLPPTGVVSVQVHPGDRELFGLIRRAATVDPWVVLKSPFGDVLRVKLGSLDRDRGEAGIQSLSFDYRTVA